ncbi:MAG: Na+/H+ antiporter subunit E [Gammaproteobacteria bacterium]|nr:Na+/H+ antiporter subunit E [Gammaproteobacteria bacterium]
MDNPRVYPHPGSALLRLLLLALLWWVISEGNQQLWWGGVVAVVLAFWAGRGVQPLGWRWPCWRRVPRFILFFLRHSLTAGVAVAARAVRVDPGFHPQLLHYPNRLPPGPRELLVAIISLMPGTLVAALGDDGLQVHALDTDGSRDAIADAERQVASLFDVTLSRSDGHG